MNVRNLTISVAVLLVLCAVAWFLQRPAATASEDPRVGGAVLDTEVAAGAARVQIANAGKSVELARGVDGSWTVPSYHDFPADFAKLSKLVGDLTAAKIQRLVTSRPDRPERLEFKDTTISLNDAAGAELWRVTLGKNAEGGGRFLRYGNEERGYLANLSLWLDTEPKNWADAVILSLKPDEIARVEIGFNDSTHAPVVVTRASKDEAWGAEPAAEGQQLKPDRIASLISSFSSLRFTDTAAPDDERAAAARENSRTLKFTNFDGASWTISLGRKPEEKVLSATKPKDESTATEVGRVAPNAPSAEETTKEDEAESAASNSDATHTAEPKEPEFETIPAGPVFVSITSSDASARINALMQKRALQISEWTYTSLPQAPADLFEPAPTAPAAPQAAPQ